MEEEGQEKKLLSLLSQRGPSFSKNEVKVLLGLIENHKSVILNKSTSTEANHAKDLAWNKIVKSFNEHGFENVRTAESLRTKWDNLKRGVKKLSKNSNEEEFSDLNSQIISLIAISEKHDSLSGLPSEDYNVSETGALINNKEIKYWDDNDDGAMKQSDTSDGNHLSERHRGPSFSKTEVKVLINLIEKYKNIILNRSTTSANSQAKEMVWIKIAKYFNEQGFKHERTEDSLRMKWDNLKRDARKITKNLINEGCSEFDNMNSKIVSLIYESEKYTNSTDVSLEIEVERNADEQKESKPMKCWDDNEDNSMASDESDGDNAHERINRAMNFSPQECSLLLQCVREEKNHVFDKDNSIKAVKLKNKAWSRITCSFNKKSPIRRSTKCLRTKFSNLKKSVKNVDFKNVMAANRHEKLVEISNKEIKLEPLFDYKEDVQSDQDMNEHEDDYNDVATDSFHKELNVPVPDPLSTVLNGDSGLGSMSHFGLWNEYENKEIANLKINLLNYQMETAKIDRKRIEAAAQAESAAHEAKAKETSLRLRAARLEMIAAEMKLPASHPALQYTFEETRAQQYLDE